MIQIVLGRDVLTCDLDIIFMINNKPFIPFYPRGLCVERCVKNKQTNKQKM